MLSFVLETQSIMFYLSTSAVGSLAMQSSPSRKTSLSMGLSSTDVLVFNLTDRTSPTWLLFLIYNMWPSGHRLLGVDSSAKSTMSFTDKLHLLRFQRCCCCRVGRYSLTHRRQNTSATYCTWRYRCRVYRSCLPNRPGGNIGPARKRRRWFGVRAS